MTILAQLALALIISVVAYVIMPKPEAPKVEAQEFDPPDARADKPMSIVFGTKKITDVNCIAAFEKSTKKKKA